MKVFLLQSIRGIGSKGEIKEVSDGHARNFLIPKGLVLVCEGAQEAAMNERFKSIKKQEEVEKKKQSVLCDRISSLKLKFIAKAHEDGRLYGSIGAAEIVEKLAEQGVSVSKKQIMLDKPYRTTGTRDLIIRLSSSIQPSVKISITAG